MSFNDLLGLVGDFLGYGGGLANGDTAWDEQDERRIKNDVKSGLRQFYFPKVPYAWSFLMPVGTVTLLDGESTVLLPSDFGNLLGNVSVTDDDRIGFDLALMPPGYILNQFATFATSTGRPEACCVRPKKGTTIDHGQRWELHIYPTADQDYTLTFPYSVVPDALQRDHPYPYGGTAHAETIRAACLKAAEATRDNTVGVWAREFEERLAASIANDMKLKPALLGYNSDRSDERFSVRRRRWHDRLITFNGVNPEA